MTVKRQVIPDLWRTNRKCLVHHDEGRVRTAKQRFCQFLAYDSKLRSMLTAALLFVHCRSFLYAKFTIWSQTSLFRCLSRSVLLYLIMSYALCGGHFCLTWIMAALRSRCGHYVFALWFLSSFFIPHLISAVGDWMFTILPHMVWP